MIKEKLIKKEELWLGHEEIPFFEGEVIVDVHSTLGSYCGSFICHKTTFKELEKYNKTNKGANYFSKR